MENERRKVMLRLGLMAAAFVLLVGGAIYFKSWWVKVPLILLAGALGAFLGRIAISYRRKKYYFEGKVLSITPPKGRFGKHAIIVKNGKISKKLFALQKPNMKVGGMYGLYFEEKSFEILKYEPLKVQVMRSSKGQAGPQHK